MYYTFAKVLDEKNCYVIIEKLNVRTMDDEEAVGLVFVKIEKSSSNTFSSPHCSHV